MYAQHHDVILIRNRVLITLTLNQYRKKDINRVKSLCNTNLNAIHSIKRWITAQSKYDVPDGYANKISTTVVVVTASEHADICNEKILKRYK